MKKILIATEKPFAKVAVEEIKKIIESRGFECILLEKYKTKEELKSAVSDVHGIIVRSDIIDKEIFESAPQLQIVIRAGAGYDNIDLDEATKRNIVVMNTPGQNANAVAELAIGMMIYMARNYFDGSIGSELNGKTIGIHGYGFVGRLVATKALCLGMKVFAYDPYVNKEKIESDNVVFCSDVRELYKQCQYISLHIPANEVTNNSIGYELLRLMPQGATLVNTARKEIIDEKGLLKMFEERSDFKYVSDIAPDCADQIKEKYPKRYYFTAKKCGAQTEEANTNAGLAAAQQIVRFFEFGDKKYQVNK